MRFVSRHTTIPVPLVVDCYEYNGTTYLVQEYVHGIELSDCLREMDTPSRLALANESFHAQKELGE